MKSESEVAQSCPTLCNIMDCSLPCFSVHGIFQARIQEWVDMPFSRGSSQARDQAQVSCTAGRGFNLWAAREALACYRRSKIKPETGRQYLQNTWVWMYLSLRLVQLFVTPWTVAHQGPLSMEFSRQEYWSRLPFPSPGDLPNPGIEPASPALQADSLPYELPGKQNT